MQKDLTPAVEDYLKAIYALSEAGEPATTNALAERLRVNPASITAMLQKLALLEPPLVSYQKHQGVLLTEAGRRAALKVIRVHRLLELYLVRALGFSWDEVHAEADRLEHAVSDHLEEHLSEALGHPLVDPHGEPIPSSDLQIGPASRVSLLSLRGGDEARVARIGDDNPDLLRYLSGIGLVPQADLRVIEYIPYDQTLRLWVGAAPDPIVLGPAITAKIFVDK